MYINSILLLVYICILVIIIISYY